MKYFVLTLVFMGLMIPLACNNLTPTSSNYTNGRNGPTSTPTNLNGWTSTPTATYQPTPAFINTFAANAPNGIAYANSLIYVAQGDGASVSQVQVFNSGTNTSTWTWTNSGGVNFKYPNGVAVNSAGTTVYVLDAGDGDNTGAIYALAPAATPTPITSWTTYGATTLSEPGGIALDYNGNVYVADTLNEKIEEFGSGGATIASWGERDVIPMAVALNTNNPSSDIYVADANNELWVLSSNGNSFTVVTSWNLPWTDDLDYYGLAVDSNNNVYVSDYYNSQVEIYSNTGTTLGLFSGNETGATPLVGPDALLLYNSNIYVADYDSNNDSNTAGIIEIFGPNNY